MSEKGAKMEPKWSPKRCQNHINAREALDSPFERSFSKLFPKNQACKLGKTSKSYGGVIKNKAVAFSARALDDLKKMKIILKSSQQ